MNVLLLSDHPNIAQSIIHCLSQRGIKSAVIANEGSRFLAASRSCHALYTVPNSAFSVDGGDGMLLDTIRRLCRKHSFLAVFPTGHDSTRFLCEHKETVAKMVPVPPLPEPETFLSLYDKWQFSQLLERNDIAQPQTVLVAERSDIEGGYGLPPFPILTKPLNSHGGKGIYHFNDIDSLRGHAEHARGARGEESFFPLIAQEFIPGKDIDLSILSTHGEVVAWTVQQREPGGVFKFTRDLDILAIGQAIVDVSRYHGVAHFDMRIDARDNSVQVIECNPRFWATTYTSCFAGVNFPALCLDALDGYSDGRVDPDPGNVISLRRVVNNLLEGPSMWKDIKVGALLTSTYSDVGDQLPYLLDFLQGKSPKLARFIGHRYVARKSEAA